MLVSTLLKGTAKRYVLIPAIVIALSGLGLSHIWAYNTGKKVVEASQLEAIQEYQLQIAEVQEELNIERNKIREGEREAVTIIKQVHDASGCADAVAPPSLLQHID